jgi:hypothetical protein
MTEVREFRAPNPLAAITQNGGMLISEALGAANEALKDMRKPSLRAIDRLLAAMNQHFGPSSRRGDEDFQALYELAGRIIDVSSPVAEMQIDRAAFSLCELVDRCANQSRWDWPSVDVHLDALQLLRHSAAALKAPERKAILDGLDRVTERLPAAVEAAPDETAD